MTRSFNETLAEVRRREKSWYDYTRTYEEGVLASAAYKNDPTHESSYTLTETTIVFGDGLVVDIPQGPFRFSYVPKVSTTRTKTAKSLKALRRAAVKVLGTETPRFDGDYFIGKDGVCLVPVLPIKPEHLFEIDNG